MVEHLVAIQWPWRTFCRLVPLRDNRIQRSTLHLLSRLVLPGRKQRHWIVLLHVHVWHLCLHLFVRIIIADGWLVEDLVEISLDDFFFFFSVRVVGNIPFWSVFFHLLGRLGNGL